ncbi:MAG: TIGR03936 family radical SAM-associated protein [Oscillospiraceae bacterium]|nr:TIGR03936 family radical SAM-associated protein [Oscillospiraceae bacterium]
MDRLRMRFEKTGRAVWISHLDLMATMQRAFSRADYRLKYSEGFNPHPLISILLPLSVGTGSVCELMDFRLQEDCDLSELPERLTAKLPEGITVKEVYEAERKSAQLKWLRIEGQFLYDERDPAAICEGVRRFYEADSIVIEKKTKRGIGETDIRPAIREIDFTPAEKMVRVAGVISAQEPTLNPDLLSKALQQLQPDLAPDHARFTRIETYDSQMRIFR